MATFDGKAYSAPNLWKPNPWKPNPTPQVPQENRNLFFTVSEYNHTPIPQVNPPNQTKLIINYLPQNLSDDTFRMLFQSIGPLKSCKICRQKPSGYSYGFGFVEYFSPDHAQLAIDTLNGHQIESKRLKVAFSRPGGDNCKGANLYIRNIPRQMREAGFRNMLEVYGNVVNCRILQDKATGMSRGCGFVLYDKKTAAQAAIDALSGTMLSGSTQALIIRFADDNATKVRPPATQFMPRGGVPSFRMGGVGPMRPPTNRFQSRFNPMGVTLGGNSGAPIRPQQPLMAATGNTATGNIATGNIATGTGCTLYVYNIGYDADQGSIAALFAQYGPVQKVDVIMDWQKNQSKGFCFVTMATLEAAQTAINNLNGYQYTNRPLQVSFYTAKK